MAVDFETPQEDLRNWIVDNWETTVSDCIGFALSTMVVDEKKENAADAIKIDLAAIK